MDFELFKDIFDKINAETSQYDSLTFPGLGEPLLDDAFDEWMRRNYPNIKFERYCDDIVVHCKSEKDAKQDFYGRLNNKSRMS